MPVMQEELSMLVRFLSLVIAVYAAEMSVANDTVVLKNDRTSKTDGYWNTEQGYFVGSYFKAAEGEKPGLIIFRLGFVNTAVPTVSQGTTFLPATIIGPKNQKIGRMWLVIREQDHIRLRAPLLVTLDTGNYVHMSTEFNATAELWPQLEIEFEEVTDTTTRTIVVPLKEFSLNR
jgi:hypothetical protein